MRALWAIALVGCGFQPNHSIESIDAAHPIDGPLTPDSPPANIEFRQSNSAENMSHGSESIAFSDKAQLAGDLNVVAVGWFKSGTVDLVSDSAHNAYELAIGPTATPDGQQSQSIYYACNIAAAPAGANTVTVTFKDSGQDPDVRIAEYSGIATTGCLDAKTSETGTGTAIDSGMLTTAHAHELLVGADKVDNLTMSADPDYMLRVNTGFGDIIEDLDVSTIGSYQASAVQNEAGDWVMQLVSFIAK